MSHAPEPPASAAAQLELCTLLATRFAHDMAGPINAVHNGMEYVADPDPAMARQATDLLSLSAQEAMAKLHIYRMAYGRAGDSPADIQEFQSLCAQFFAHSKFALQWGDVSMLQSSPLFTHSKRQLWVHVVLMVAAHLIYGGTLRMGAVMTGGKITQLQARGEAKKLHVPAEMAAMLRGQEVPLSTTTAPVRLLQALAVAQHATLDYDVQDTKVELCLHLA